MLLLFAFMCLSLGILLDHSHFLFSFSLSVFCFHAYCWRHQCHVQTWSNFFFLSLFSQYYKSQQKCAARRWAKFTSYNLFCHVRRRIPDQHKSVTNYCLVFEIKIYIFGYWNQKDLTIQGIKLDKQHSNESNGMRLGD